MEYLDRMGLKEWANHLPNELSGGQKQRVAIARSMISKPKVILADEPTGALDSKTSLEVMDIFDDINKQGITVIIVTHERDIAERTRRIIHLKDGIIEEDYYSYSVFIIHFHKKIFLYIIVCFHPFYFSCKYLTHCRQEWQYKACLLPYPGRISPL